MERLVGALQAIIIDNRRAIAALRGEGRLYLCDVETNGKMLARVLRDATRLIDVSADIGLAIAQINEIERGVRGNNVGAPLPPPLGVFPKSAVQFGIGTAPRGRGVSGISAETEVQFGRPQRGAPTG
jgi:hypothetical protein